VTVTGAGVQFRACGGIDCWGDCFLSRAVLFYSGHRNSRLAALSTGCQRPEPNLPGCGADDKNQFLAGIGFTYNVGLKVLADDEW
jgi:hypothetical protein